MICSLNLYAAAAHVLKDGVYAKLVDDAKALLGHAHFYVTLLAFNPDALVVQIGQEAASRPVIRVRNVIAGHWSFSGDLADAGHLQPLKNQLLIIGGYAVRRVLYQYEPPETSLQAIFKPFCIYKSEHSTARQRDAVVVTDDKMIKQTDIHQFQRVADTLGDQLV